MALSSWFGVTEWAVTKCGLTTRGYFFALYFEADGTLQLEFTQLALAYTQESLIMKIGLVFYTCRTSWQGSFVVMRLANEQMLTKFQTCIGSANGDVIARFLVSYLNTRCSSAVSSYGFRQVIASSLTRS